MSDWLKNIRIGVIGNGTVGQATARSYLEHVAEVRCFDTVKERCTHGHSNVGMGKVLACDIIFICLPTPQKANSLECDTSIVEAFFRDLKGPDHDYTAKNLVLRSTVPIGTTRRLAEKYRLPNLVHSPEFLTARCATVDAQMPTRNIVGIPRREITGLTDGAEALWNLYAARFPGIPILRVTSNESEAVKLFQNGFFAVKVAYWNEVYCLAEKLGLDWETVRNAILADGRIHHSHTQVPGPDGKFGFGGACLPKDLSSLLWQSIECGTVQDTRSLLSAAHFRNLKDRQRGESK